MNELFINRYSKSKQTLIGLLLIATIAAASYFLLPFTGYRVIGLMLLLGLSVLSVLFDIVPVLIAACFSALIWDYFFIPPHFTLHIGSTEDMILLLMYFVIASVSAILTFKIRQIEKIANERKEKEHVLKLYNTLLNSLSHELRTPIASIIGATDNLQNNNGKLSASNHYDLLAEISKASFRLNQQVENLLNMSRLESGIIRPKKDWNDINEVVYDVVGRIEEDRPSQRISININPEVPLFKIDKGMLEQVLYNLLNNATQYTPASGLISIEAACHADVLSLVIEDDGPGFPKDEISLVFDKFYRLHNSRTGGTGLGLSIVKGFVEAMNGTIHLKNRDTGGARFTIDIPADTSYIKNLKNE